MPAGVKRSVVWRRDEAERAMTETREPKIISDALAVIDKGLAEMLNRELISTDEVADLLLDVRMLLASSDVEPIAH
jgi:hypothetical protein